MPTVSARRRARVRHVLYRLLHWVAGVALDWFYGNVEVVGAERVPRDAPLLLASNHPNQLIDALLVARAVPRRVTFTGKAVLMENPVVAVLARAVGFVPIRRAQDARGETAPDPSRNAAAFDAIIGALARRAAVLIFPEGISHDRPELAPVKTGVARIALQARDERGVRDVHIVPIGLTFERKWAARTRVLVQIGEPIAMDAWRASDDGAPDDAPAAVAALTAEVERRLRDVTLNFPSREAADVVLPSAHLLAALLEGEPRPLSNADAPLPSVVAVARRAEAVRRAVEQGSDGAQAARVARFVERLDRLRDTLERSGIAPSEVDVDPGIAAGAWFVLREAALVVLGGPVALWGRVNHWLPLTVARLVARRTSRAPEDPAMHTIVVGVVTVPVFYALQAALVWRLTGSGWWALAYLVTLPPSAGWWLRYGDRLARARRRVRAYLRLRRDPALGAEIRREVRWMRAEATAVGGGR